MNAMERIILAQKMPLSENLSPQIQCYDSTQVLEKGDPRFKSFIAYFVYAALPKG
jgi:hypothetical protein